jgi:uncharacterized protein YyaL (SSP411 family)
MTNRLAQETSPYLLQHSENPVDWLPWGQQAFAMAKSGDKPIFLSIGYSACHWCHVMAHESFEDSQIAQLINENFIAIKVDREEHPDVDQVYMEAVQMLMGHGGWPLSVFLTPEREPFFGGTYWPPRQRGPMPGFEQVLRAVAEAWKHRRNEAMEQARNLTQMLRDSILTDTHGQGGGELAPGLLQEAYAALSRSFDPHDGGFGQAPKFPHPMHLRLLLRRWRSESLVENQEPVLNMVRLTLDRMAAGGIYDHLGGGFHRYSTDAQWLVPHFEKMLYDNALLAACYVESWLATGNRHDAQVARETLDYVLRDMTDPAGGFHSAEDADSEGHEGCFYLWTLDEIRGVLGRERAGTFAAVYDVTQTGNFEGRNILNLPKSIEHSARILGRQADALEAELAEDRCQLFAARATRNRPAKDDKVLVSWNGLMIDTLAQAGVALNEPRYLEAAQRAATFLLENVRRNGRLLHTWRRGRAAIDGLLEDYAGLTNALVSLYEARFDERWIDEAVDLADAIVERFMDHAGGGFYMTADDQDAVILRRKETFDSSVPSSSGLAATALLRLGKLCGRNDYLEAADGALRNAVPIMEQAPVGAGQMLLTLDMQLGPAPELVIYGSSDPQANEAVLGDLRRRYMPNKTVAFRDPAADTRISTALHNIFQGKQPAVPGPTLYVCEHLQCRPPVAGKDATLSALAALAGRG